MSESKKEEFFNNVTKVSEVQSITQETSVKNVKNDVKDLSSSTTMKLSSDVKEKKETIDSGSFSLEKDNSKQVQLSNSKDFMKTMSFKTVLSEQIENKELVKCNISDKSDIDTVPESEKVDKNEFLKTVPFIATSILENKKTLDEQKCPASPGQKTGDQIETLSSEISLGFGEIVSEIEERAQTLVIREGPESYKTILRTVCAYAIRCPHGRLPIKKMKDHNGFWFPYVYANEDEKYLNTIEQIYECFVHEFKSSSEKSNSKKSDSSVQKSKTNKQESNKFLSNIQLFNIYRFQIPDGQFISRFIFFAQWTSQDSAVVCCKETPNIKWLSLETLVQESKHTVNKSIMDDLWGYEIFMAAPALLQFHQGKIITYKYPNILEFTSTEILKYLNKNPNSTRSSSTNQFASLLTDAKFFERDGIKIYCDFVQHCYPAMNMTFCAFSEYFNKLALMPSDENSLRSIFRSFCNKNKNFLVFSEFLLGLAALDLNTPNSLLRCTYIFKYYDHNADNFMDEDDFRHMITDIRDKSNFSCDQKDVDTDVKTKLSQLKLLDDKKRINLDAFLREALSGRLSGTTYLFRANKPILETVHMRHAYEYILNKTGKPFGPRLVGTCPKCKPKQYSLAYHAVKLNSQGRIDEPKPLISLNCGEIDGELQFKKKANEMEIKHSIEVVFNENSVANKVLAIVRKMVDFNKLPRERKSEISQFVVQNLTVDLIIQLCKEMTEILMIEPRVVKVNTPVIVMGDLHGNINDLLTYEEQLWPLAPTSNAPNVLFLGDYVDRGDYSIEVISYLFAMKILAPTKFFLLRGNHEIRVIQRNFTFARECMIKYFYQHGQRVFEEFNSTFDHLPLVGIIDESIYCAHGGIPFSVSKIEELYKIPIPLPDPESQSKAAWEILWSDPVTDEEYTQVYQFKNQAVDNGFTDNLRRSTAYYFAEKALKNFLKANNLSHVIRAHELEAEGYRFHHSGLLITVFSSSRYCNSHNKSAAVFVNSRENDGFIKVIALDT